MDYALGGRLVDLQWPLLDTGALAFFFPGLPFVTVLHLDPKLFLEPNRLRVRPQTQRAARDLVHGEVPLVHVLQRDHAVLEHNRRPLLLCAPRLAVRGHEPVRVGGEKLAVGRAKVRRLAPRDARADPHVRDVRRHQRRQRARCCAAPAAAVAVAVAVLRRARDRGERDFAACLVKRDAQWRDRRVKDECGSNDLLRVLRQDPVCR